MLDMLAGFDTRRSVRQGRCHPEGGSFFGLSEGSPLSWMVL